MENNTSKVYEPASEPLLSATGAGSPLFVINLCASMAPLQMPAKALPGLESYRLYQVSRREDGRTRHRLRLGFFTDENEAGMVLASVRGQYPTAFTTSLCDEDRRFVRGYTAAAANRPAVKPVAVAAPVAAARAPHKVAPAASSNGQTAATTAAPKSPVSSAPAQKAVAAQKAAPAKAAPAAKAPPAQKAAPARQPAPLQKPAATQPAPGVQIIELTWEPDVPPAAKPQAASTKPAAAVKPSSSSPPQTPEIEISWEPPKKAAAAPAAASQQAKRDEVRLPQSKATVELTLEAEPPRQKAPAQPPAAPAQPFHVGKGVELPDVKLGLEAETKPSTAATPVAAKNAAAAKTLEAPKTAPAIKPAPTAPKAAVAKPAASKPAASAAKPPAAAPAAPTRPAVPAPNGLDLQLPELDSTQTIRALTSTELSDESQEKWFAIQLAVSDQPVNLDAMPRLDIFEAYRLYSVATAGSGKIVHSLRLGFFREAVSAEAVSGYLKTFFGSPSVMRISMAEQLRFKDPPQRKPATAAKSESNVVALNARERSTPVIPTVTIEVTPTVDTKATGSFKLNNTGKFKTSDTGSFKLNNTGTFKPNETGSFKPNATGAHAATKVAAKSAVATRSATKTSSTGKFRATRKPTLAEQLLEEAREVELSESAIRKLPKNDSLLARLVGKLTK